MVRAASAAPRAACHYAVVRYVSRTVVECFSPTEKPLAGTDTTEGPSEAGPEGVLCMRARERSCLFSRTLLRVPRAPVISVPRQGALGLSRRRLRISVWEAVHRYSLLCQFAYPSP
eukprot:6201640-Pleurochrysis_carterae.AAC.4